MRNLRRLSRKRVAGVAAAVVAGGALGAALLMPAAVSAQPLINTVTSITGTTQLLSDPGIPPVLKIDVSVTANGGPAAPAGNVVVKADAQHSCTASLTASSGTTATGNCDLSNLQPGPYTLNASYQGGGELSASVSRAYHVMIGGGQGSPARISTSLNCPRRVFQGQIASCTLKVVNNGSGSAHSVSASIALPSPLRARFCGRNWWNSWFQRGFNGCEIRNNTAFWHVGVLKPGQSVSETLNFSVRNQWHNGRHQEWVWVRGVAIWQNWDRQWHSSVSFASVRIRQFWWQF